VSDRFLIRQLFNAGMVGNAHRPIPGDPASVPAFFAGWLTAELSPHALALTAADIVQHTARHGLRSRSDRWGVAAGVVAMAGYAALIQSGHRAKVEVEDALVEALGAGYTDALSKAPTPADLATPWSRLVNPFKMRHVDVVARRRLPYHPGGRRFELDVYHHKDTPPNAPVLLQVHGGGWVIGKKEEQGIPLMMHMAARGWVCVAINYPLAPRSRWPEHIVGVKRSVAWIREHIAEYGGDPDFIAVTGGSAGAHLSALLALTANDPAFQPGFDEVDTSVQACVPHYGVYDFTAEDGTRGSRVRLDSLIRPLVMAKDAVYPDDFRNASPIYRVNSDAPPFFVLHGSNDTLVPVADARAFVRELRAVSKAPVAYAEIRGAQHAFDIFPSIRSAHVVRGVERFLDWAYGDWRRVNRAEGPAGARPPA
jgi:acetyl esterase/lipase